MRIETNFIRHYMDKSPKLNDAMPRLQNCDTAHIKCFTVDMNICALIII